MTRREMEKEIDRLGHMVDLMNMDLSRTEAKASVNRSKTEAMEIAHRQLRGEVASLGERVSSLKQTVSNNLSASAMDVGELHRRINLLREPTPEECREGGARFEWLADRVDKLWTDFYMPAPHAPEYVKGYEAGMRNTARRIRSEVHLGASWSEFRDWIGREFLNE